MSESTRKTHWTRYGNLHGPVVIRDNVTGNIGNITTPLTVSETWKATEARFYRSLFLSPMQASLCG
jgi:hypothetical protein